MQLNEKLQLLRKIKNLTQNDIADKLYVSRQTVQKWESGLSSPDLYKLPEIAKIFEISTDDLLNENITEKELLQIVLLGKKENESAVEKNLSNNNRYGVDFLVSIPINLGIFILIFMGYIFGAMAVFIMFSLSGLSGIWGVYSIFNTILNFKNGIEAIVISIGFIFLGFGLVLPVFHLSKQLLNIYKIVLKRLNEYVKEKSVLRRFFKK